MVIKKIRLNAINPPMAKIISMLMTLALLVYVCDSRWIGQLFPRSHVGDAVLVAGDDDFHALDDRGSILAARRRRAPGAGLRKDHLAGAGWANVAADGAEHADHIVVGGIQFFVVADENLGEEKEHDGRAGEPARAGDGEAEQNPEGGKSS